MVVLHLDVAIEVMFATLGARQVAAAAVALRQRQMDQELSIAQGARTRLRPLAEPGTEIEAVGAGRQRMTAWRDDGIGMGAMSLRGGPTNAHPVIRTTYDHPGIIIPYALYPKSACGRGITRPVAYAAACKKIRQLEVMAGQPGLCMSAATIDARTTDLLQSCTSAYRHFVQDRPAFGHVPLGGIAR